jgi:hypothetical protein
LALSAELGDANASKQLITNQGEIAAAQAAVADAEAAYARATLRLKSAQGEEASGSEANARINRQELADAVIAKVIKIAQKRGTSASVEEAAIWREIYSRPMPQLDYDGRVFDAEGGHDGSGAAARRAREGHHEEGRYIVRAELQHAVEAAAGAVRAIRAAVQRGHYFRDHAARRVSGQRVPQPLRRSRD